MSLFQMSVAGGVLILFIVVVRALAIHRLPKTTFLALWMIAALRLLLPFSIPLPFNIHIGLDVFSDVVQELPSGNIASPLPGDSPPSYDIGTAVPSPATEPISTFEILWLVGVLLLALYFSISYLRSMRKFRMSIPDNTPYIREWLTTHQITRSIEARSSDLISSPLTYGILHPVILLPKKLDRNDQAALKYVLTHEYVHIRRFDAITKILFAAVLCIHWFNPLVWVMYVLANRDIELSCDETVIRQFGENTRAVYAKVLISMEETRSGFTPLCNNFSRNAIEERITAIMKTRKTTVVSLVLAALIVAGTTTVFATSALAESKGSMDTNYYETETSEGILTSYTDDNGETHYVLDDGNTTRTLSEEEFEQQYPSPVIEWWTYDEYKNWLDNEKETLQSIIGQKGWTSAHGEFVWTQEMVDETIAEYEKVLQDIKNGMMYSKTVDGEQDIMVGYNPEDIVTSSSYDYFVKLENGEEKLFGPYETADELLAAVESFCNDQVKLGNMDQREAREIVSQCVQN